LLAVELQLVLAGRELIEHPLRTFKFDRGLIVK
jgi:hypothetical protein